LLNLREGSKVEVSVSNGKIIINYKKINVEFSLHRD